MTSRFLVPFAPMRNLGMGSDPFVDLHREIDRLFDETFRGTGSRLASAPRIDVHEIDNGLELTAETPGVSEKDIDLSLDGDLLTIRGEKHNERQDSHAHLVERSYGSFQRSVQLPFAPDPDRVEADFENGVLHVTLPRPAQQEKSRRIEVRGSSGARQQGDGKQAAESQNGGPETEAAASADDTESSAPPREGDREPG